MGESADLEFKREWTKTSLKTVSAFANYGTGRIVFGVDDDGTVVGVSDPADLCLRIENSIGDSLSPVPHYDLQVDEGKGTVIITVYEGDDKPYRSQGRAYRRRGVSTREVSGVELNRLILMGANTSFDALESRDQDLAFSALEGEVRDKMGVDGLDTSALVSLELMDARRRYTNAAALLADANGFPGCDVARFGDSPNIILGRHTCKSVSLLTQLEEVVSQFEEHYVYEEVEGTERVVKSLVPREAFREAVANALVHRCWDVSACIKISMYPDRIEVMSPGGLPMGISREDYLAGGPSVARNPIVANVFYRLGYIERFGTGIPRIREAYRSTDRFPDFVVRDTSITVVLPVLSPLSLGGEEERRLLRLMDGGVSLSRREVEDLLGITKGQAIRRLNELVDKGLVEKRGAGRAVSYRRV